MEVSDATLAFDRGVKAGVYARAGVPEYWVVNLRDRTLIVHRGPDTLVSETGGGYASVVVRQPGDTVTSLLAPTALVAVADLLA